MAGASQDGLYRRSNALIVVPLVVLLTLAAGALGYLWLGQVEGQEWDYADCLYMTVISLTTVGYGEVLPIEDVPYARAYTMVLLVFGYVIMVWAVSSIIAVFVEGRVSEALWRRRMQDKINQLKDHFIVIGVGHTGRHVVAEMRRTKRPVVVVDRSREQIEALAAEVDGLLFIEADAEEEQTLRSAWIERAKGLVTCLAQDKDNIFVVLSARQLNANLRIISRVDHFGQREKILRAGADVVVAPNYIGGLRIASEMIRPHVTTFLDMMLRDRDHTIRIEEVALSANCSFVGKTISEAAIHEHTGLLVLATHAQGEDGFTYSPPAHHRLEAGMTLVVLGDVDNVHKLREITGG